MNYLHAEYLRLRKVGFPARQAIAYARTIVRFEDLEDSEAVRLRTVPDPDPDLSWLDQPDWIRDRDSILRQVEQDGVWILLGEYRCPACGQWVVADSCGGFIGDGWRDSGYDFDIMRETIDQRAAAGRSRSP